MITFYLVLAVANDSVSTLRTSGTEPTIEHYVSTH